MTMTQEQTLSDFIESHGITAEVEWADSNPNASDWGPDARHFLVTLRCEGREMAVPFTQGSAHTEEPTAEDILDCLASDIASVRNEDDWLAWAREAGYESIEDAEKARNTYRVISEQANALALLLPRQALETLLWETERL